MRPVPRPRSSRPPTTQPAAPYRLAALPEQARALLVIASQDFYWREYAETRQGLLDRFVAFADVDPAAYDGIVDGRIITGQDFQAATRFGEVLADRVRFDRP